MILDELKRRTRAQHERIEQRVPLLREDLSRSEYRNLLSRWLGFYLPLEAALAQVRGWDGVAELDRESRRKVPLLQADLRFLGAAAAPSAGCAAPADLPCVGTLPRALGCMYVTEGATLGGAIIARHLARTLGVTPATGCAFYGGYGPRTGPMWKAFGATLEAYALAHPAAAADIIDAACETFVQLDRWLSGAPVA